MAKTNSNLTGSLEKLEDTLNEWFVKKAPVQLPESVKEFIVAFGPWITVVMLVLLLPTVFALLGLSAILAPFAALGGVSGAYSWGLSSILLIVTLVFEVLALPGLFARKRAGWNMLFYSSLVTAVGNLISMNLGGLVIGSAITWFFLFQVRSYYK